MDGDDITTRNQTVPEFPEGLPLWFRITCVLGYHKRETRKTGPNHEYPGMSLRDQCGRCNKLLDWKRKESP
jgi:hypothetical protein